MKKEAERTHFSEEEEEKGDKPLEEECKTRVLTQIEEKNWNDLVAFYCSMILYCKQFLGNQTPEKWYLEITWQISGTLWVVLVLVHSRVNSKTEKEVFFFFLFSFTVVVTLKQIERESTWFLPLLPNQKHVEVFCSFWDSNAMPF